MKAIEQIEDVETNNKNEAIVKEMIGLGLGLVKLAKGGKGYASKTDKSPMKDADKAVTALYRGFNIGVALGPQKNIELPVMVLDLDIAKDGKAPWSEFILKYIKTLPGEEQPGPLSDEKLAEWLVNHFKTRAVRTASGGYHFYFQWDSAFSRRVTGVSIDGAKHAVDLLTCTEGSHLHVVAPPSVVDDGKYELIRGGLPAEMSVELKVFLLSIIDRGNENVTDEDINLDTDPAADPEEIRKAAEAIDVKRLRYNEWLKVGMAIHHAMPNEDGLALWDEISKNDDRYKVGECRQKWEGFKRGGTSDGRRGITIKTLFEIAKEHGHSTGYTRLIDAINAEYARVVIGGDERIIHFKNGSPFNATGDLRLLKVGTARGNLKPHKISVGNGMKQKQKQIFDIWWDSLLRRDYPDGVGLYAIGKEPPKVLNLWTGFNIKPEYGEWPLLEKWIRESVCGGDEEAYEYLLNLLAYKVQHPTENIEVVVFMWGLGGTGKSMFTVKLMRRIFGKQYVSSPSKKMMKDLAFNTYMEGKLIISPQEVIVKDRKLVDHINATVTDETVEINRKNVNTYNMPNTSMWMLTANEDDFGNLPISLSDSTFRRWFIIRSGDSYGVKFNDSEETREKRNEFFAALDEEIRNGDEPRHLLNYLLNRKVVKKDILNPPRTKDLNRTIQAGRAKEPMYEFIADYFSGLLGPIEWGTGKDSRYLKAGTIRKDIDRWAKENRAKDKIGGDPMKKFKKIVADSGAVKPVRSKKGWAYRFHNEGDLEKLLDYIKEMTGIAEEVDYEQHINWF